MNEPARQVSSRSDFAQIPVRSGLGGDAIRLGTMVYDHSQEPGAHNTPAAEEGNDRLSHLKGKYGELVFSEWLSANRLAASHTPFRDNYRVKVFDDDFIINQKRVEIKTKRRGEASAFPPSIKYNVNMGLRDLSHDIYVFVEIDPTGSFEQDPAAAIVGWATPRLVKIVGVRQVPGQLSANGKFTFKRYDWDLEIRRLYKPSLLRQQFD